MPKELLEIKNFTLGIQTTPSETDINHEAASYSLNVDPIAQDGKLQAIPDVVSKNASFGSNVGMLRTIDDGDDGNKRIIIGYEGDGDGDTDGTINYAYNVEGTTPSLTTALVSNIDDSAVANETLDMEVNNKEVHIALGSSNAPKWVGKIDHEQFGVSYASTNNGFYGTDATLDSPSQFKSCYKWVWTRESGTNYVHGIEWKGNRVYRFKEDTPGTAYSFVGASETRFASTQGIASRYVSGGSEDATTATLWIFDAGTGASGTLYAYDPLNDETKKDFTIIHDWENDTDHTYISDIVEAYTASSTRLIHFSKHYDNEYPIVHKDYYTGNSEDLHINYGLADGDKGGFGIGMLYATSEASNQGSAAIPSKNIYLKKNTPTLFWEDGADNIYATGMPYYKGTGNGYKSWTYIEPYNKIGLQDYNKKFLGGIVGSVGAGDLSVGAGSNYGNSDDERYLATNTCTMYNSGSGDWSGIHSNYANCRFINGIMQLYPAFTSSGTPVNGWNTDWVTDGTAADGTAFQSHLMNNNIAIDSDSKLIFFVQRSAAGVHALYSVLSAVKYTVNDTRGTASDQYGVSLAIANTTEANITHLQTANNTVYGDEISEVVVDPNLKCVIIAKGYDGVSLFNYTESSGNWTLGTERNVTCSDLFGETDSRVNRLAIDIENQALLCIGQDNTGSTLMDNSDKNYHAWCNYGADSLSAIGSGSRTSWRGSFTAAVSLDGKSNQYAQCWISDATHGGQSNGYHIGIVTYNLSGAKGSYTGVSIDYDYQQYKASDQASGGMIPMDIHLDGKNGLIHVSERHESGSTYDAGSGTTLQKVKLSDSKHYYRYQLTSGNNVTDTFSSTDGDGDTTSGAGGNITSCFGNTHVQTFTVEGGKFGAHIQGFSYNETDREDLAYGMMTFTSDGKYMIMGGTPDNRSLLFVKRNINNKGTTDVGKGIFTHMQGHFRGSDYFHLSGTLMGKVVLDENYHLLFTQDVTNNAIKAFMYCTDDDYRLTTPRANLVATNSEDLTNRKAVGLLWRTAHPLGTPFQFADGEGTIAKWWIHGIHTDSTSDIGSGVAAGGIDLATDANAIRAVPSGTESSVRCLQWTNNAKDWLYDADIIGFGNLTGKNGLAGGTVASRHRHLVVFSKKSDTETYITTYQKHDAMGPIFSQAPYTHDHISYDVTGSSSDTEDSSINDGDVNIPRAMGALRFNKDSSVSDLELYGFIASSQSGTSLTASLKKDGSSDVVNPDDGSTYNPTDDEIGEGPTSKAFLDTPVVISIGGTLKKAYKYFYKLSFVYDGYQESPLGDDLQIETTYQSTDYTDGALSSTAEPIADNTVSIKLNVNVNSSIVNKRITAVKLYRAESSDIAAVEPEGFYRLVSEKATSSGWNLSSVAGVKPDFTENRVYTVYDTGSVYQNFEANTGINEIVDTYDLKYTCSTQLNNTHFVGNCSTALDSSLLGSNYIVKSKPYNFDQFDVLMDALRLPGTPRALHAFQGRVYAFCKNNTYKIEPNNLFIEDTWEGIGTFNQKSVFSTDYGMCWCDKNNIYLYDGSRVQTIGDTILKGDSVNSWQEGDVELGSAAVKPQVFWDAERRAFLILFTHTDTHRRIWAYSVMKKRWDLWDVGDNVPVTSFTSGPNGEIYYTNGTFLNQFAGHSTTRKPLSWHSKKLTMGMDTQIKLFKKVRVTGTDGDGLLDADITGLTFESPDGTVNHTHVDKDTQAEWSLTSNNASEWLKVKLDADDTDALTIDAIGVVYRRRPIR